MGRPSGFPLTDPCLLDVFGGLVSPRGLLLRVWPGDVLGREGSSALMPELSCRIGVAVIAPLFLAVVAVRDGELAGPIVVDADSERDVARPTWRSVVHIQGVRIPEARASLRELASCVDVTDNQSSMRGSAWLWA
jgi:hypothetical protein